MRPLWARSVGASIVCGDDYDRPEMGTAPAVDGLGGPKQLARGLFVV